MMTTKNKFLEQVFPHSIPLINDNRYTNLNLNVTNSSSDPVTVKSVKNKTIKDKTQENESTNYNVSRRRSWNSDERESLKRIQTTQPNIFQQKKNQNGYSNGGSTLSLHMAAYEADNPPRDVAKGSPEERIEKTKSRLKKKVKKTQFEQQFPRQQESATSSKPEVQNFKTSDRLFNPSPATPFITFLNVDPASLPNNRKRKCAENASVIQENEILLSVSHPTPPPPPPPPNHRPSTTANTRKCYIAPSLPKLMTTEELENFQYAESELREWHQQYLKQQKSQQPSPSETLEEELKRLRKENKILRDENATLKIENSGLNIEKTVCKNDLKKAKAALANRNSRSKKKRKGPKKFETYHHDSQNRIISNIWKDIVATYGHENALHIISVIHKRQVIEQPVLLTPLQTLQLLKSSGITISALRKIRSMLNSFGVNNPFASDAAVNVERAAIHGKVKMVKKTVMMEGKNGEKVETNVYSISSVLDELKDRLKTIVTSENYKPFFYKGKEEVPCVFSGDKGDDLTSVIMGVGSTKNPRNSPNNCSFLGHYKGNDSQSNIYAAFGDPGGLAEQIDSIKEVEIEIDGVLRKFKIRWFVLGDFKFLNAIAGLNSNSALFPCWGCLQKSETTYGELNLNYKAQSRTMGINKNVSQIREPLLKSIPFDHYIPPILHITLGPGAQLFEELCERARELDAAELEKQNIPEMLPSDIVRKSWHHMQENIETLKGQLEDLNNTKSLYETEAGEERYVCDSSKCFALQTDIEINNIVNNDRCCTACFKNFHPCCLYKECCPHCSQKFPTLKQSQAVMDKQMKDIEKQLKQTAKLLKEEEEKANAMISKYKLGRFAAKVEKVYEKFGGSRKAFFQEFTGKQLNKMGSNIHAIYCSFDTELKSDPKIQKIVCAIIQFFNIKKMLTTEVLSDPEIDDIEEGIREFSYFMKENLPHVRVKQKGHVFFKHLPQYVRKFGIAAFFVDECVESFHVVINKYKKRIGNRHGETRAQLLFKYNKEDTWLFDTFGNY